VIEAFPLAWPVGANLYFAPKIKDGAAVLGLQVKLRF